MNPRFGKYQVTTGLVFIVFTIGIPWYYGNLATYNSSYFRFNSVTDSNDVDITTWMLSVFFIGMSIGQLMSGTIADRAGLLKTLLVSIIIFDAGIFLTYFSVQYSVYLTILTLMAVPGFCCGVIFALSFSLVAEWFTDGHVELASSFVSMAFSIGAIMYNEMITVIINPNNLVPDSHDGNVMLFFGQEEIMDRYPRVFIPIGVLSVVLQLIGFPLLRAPDKENASEACLVNKGNANGTHSYNTKEMILCSAKTPIISKHHAANNSNETKYVEQNNKTFSDAKSQFPNPNVHCNENEGERLKLKAFADNYVSNGNVRDAPTPRKDMTPREALNSGTFYVLWLTSFYMGLGYLTINNYYKIFGQVWIHDDNFLTAIGSVSTITGATTRILTGLAIDKLGLKNVTVGFTCTSTVLLSFWYLSPRPDPWLYMVLTTTISAIFSSSFIIFPIGALRCFGRRHYPTNYGLVMTSTLLANLFVPLVFPHLLRGLGWYWLLQSVAFLGPVHTVIIIVFMPHC